jgi:hypothetical protein
MTSVRALILLSLLLVACGSRALAPSAPSGTPAVTASGMSDGVTLRVDLDRASIKPGDVVWATVTIQNTNDRPIRWVGGGCNVPGHVYARIPALYDYGKNQTDYAFADLKKRIVTVHTNGYIALLDQESWSMRSQGGRMCTADIRINELAAKGTLTSRFAWDGMIAGAAAPNGTVDIMASLDMDDAIAMVGRSVGASATVTLSGGSATRVSAAQAFDTALEDARFTSWIRQRLVASGNSQPAAYNVSGGARLDGDTWVILASQKVAPSGEIEVRVSAIDGTVRSIVER